MHLDDRHSSTLSTERSYNALRGAQAMRAPLVVAVVVNLLNAILCAALVFGIGPIAPLGVWVGGPRCVQSSEPRLSGKR